MIGADPIRSQRQCAECGGTVFYVATFLTLFTGYRKRMCRDCGHVDPDRVRIVPDSARVC
jgi:hypothetical protein